MRTGAEVARVGTFTAACLLVSNAVGSGIFTTTGFMSRDLGDPLLILVLWAVGGLLALAGALSYSELGAALPQVGGEYVYVHRAYGPLAAFLSGWTSFTMGFGAAIAAAAVGFALFLQELLPEGAPLGATLIALALVWGLTAVHAMGVEQGGRVQRWLTVLKIGAVAGFVGLGLLAGSGDWVHLRQRLPDVQPTLGSIGVSLVFVLYAYSGWNAACYIAGEVRAPGRSLPRALIGGTLFVAGLYLAVNVLYFYALPAEALAREPIVPVAEKAASALLGPPAARGITAILCLSIAGAVSSMIWAGPRVYLAMARYGALPRVFARTSTHSAPLPSIAMQSAWVTLLVLSGTFEQLVVYSGFALAIFSALAVGSVIVLRVREPELPRPYRVPLYPWVPLAFVGVSLGIAGWVAWERPNEALWSVATVAAGLPLYAVWARRPRAPKRIRPQRRADREGGAT